MSTDEKTCRSCGRRMSWRKAWARNWDSVRYCSDACRRHTLSSLDETVEAELRLALAAAGTVDPETVRFSVAVEDTKHRERIRSAARRIVASGEAVCMQGGRRVDASTVRGRFVLRRI